MATRAQLLKRNPLSIAARGFLADNAINPERVDLDSLTASPIGDKSIQVRAEVMLTMPAEKFWKSIREAEEQLAAEAAEEAALADQAQHEVGLPNDDDDGF